MEERQTVNIKIDGHIYNVPKDLTILEAARKCGYSIPSLCYWNHGSNSLASCRVCLVELKSPRGSRIVASCVYPVSECPAEKGFEIGVATPRATKARRNSVELLLSNHSNECQECRVNGDCELLNAARHTCAFHGAFTGEKTKTTFDLLSPGIVRDTSKCILCGRCIERCREATGIGILTFQNRGFETIVGPAYNASFQNSPCIQCGQCIAVCPTGALTEHREIHRIDKAMREGKKVIVQVAPAVRAAIAEEFHHPIGEQNGTGKMVAALHRLGFYRVFDTNFGADLTVMEEANELIQRVKNNKVLPQITSCSPGWINYLEFFYPDLIPNVSSCKSPHEMEGAIIKSYFAKTHNLDPKDIYVVSVMPCTAKKGETKRPQLRAVEGLRDVDTVITTRELASMIHRAGLLWDELPEEDFDQDLLGRYSGAGAIFGVTGGVMEAALRTAYHMVTGEEYEPIDFVACRGLEGVKEAEVDLMGTKLKVAMASGMANAKPLLDQIRDGKSPYAFIEIMACPGGCINGGGQPYLNSANVPHGDPDELSSLYQKRAAILYGIDATRGIRQSHNNPDIIALYQNFLREPGSELAEELLHTTYVSDRPQYTPKAK